MFILQAEDAEAHSEATMASNSNLTSRLMAKNEDVADAKQVRLTLHQFNVVRNTVGVCR